MTLHLECIGIHRRTLTLQVLADRSTKVGIGDVVRRPGDRGLEAAADLVLALRAGLETRDTPLDAELDPLVVAGLEVQAMKVGCRPPVAAIERLRALTPVVLPKADNYRDPEQREFFLLGLRLAMGETEDAASSS